MCKCVDVKWHRKIWLWGLDEDSIRKNCVSWLILKFVVDWCMLKVKSASNIIGIFLKVPQSFVNLISYHQLHSWFKWSSKLRSNNWIWVKVILNIKLNVLVSINFFNIISWLYIQLKTMDRWSHISWIEILKLYVLDRTVRLEFLNVEAVLLISEICNIPLGLNRYFRRFILNSIFTISRVNGFEILIWFPIVCKLIYFWSFDYNLAAPANITLFYN